MPPFLLSSSTYDSNAARCCRGSSPVWLNPAWPAPARSYSRKPTLIDLSVTPWSYTVGPALARFDPATPATDPPPDVADVPEVPPVVPEPAVPASEPATPPPVTPPDSAAVSPGAPAFAPELVAATGPRTVAVCVVRLSPATIGTTRPATSSPITMPNRSGTAGDACLRTLSRNSSMTALPLLQK